MKRLALVAVSVLLLGLVACIDPTPASPASTSSVIPNGNAPGGSDGGHGGTQDAGHGLTQGIVTVSHGNQLPAPWSPADITSLAADGTGTDALAYNNQLVVLPGPFDVTTSPCAVPSGAFCDGFLATDGVGSVDVNYYEFLGPHASCNAQYADGSTLNGPLEGVWQNDFSIEQTDGRYALALTSCDGLTGSITGGSNTAPATTDVQALLASYPSDGGVVTASGLVIASYSLSTGAFGFTMVDPVQPVANSGIKVYHSKTSTVTATSPSVGDYVTVTAKATSASPGFHELDLF